MPPLTDGMLLVRNHFSAISVGAEAQALRDAGFRPGSPVSPRRAEVRQILGIARPSPRATTVAVGGLHSEGSAVFGYGCAGEVIAAGALTGRFRVGQQVACAALTPLHAEVVAVPDHLCTPIPSDVAARHAAFAAHAAIAVQGIRRAELDLGANAVVIGLGMFGLLTVQLLRAAGVRVLGIDIDPAALLRASAAGADLALLRDHNGLESVVRAFTHGHGADAVLITAATDSADPLELAGAVCRPNARVVVVGSIPTRFPREQYVRKELDLRLSTLFGPGAEVPPEQHGEYPIGQVRWTASRNMQAFVDLLAAGRIDPEPLITHTFPFDRAIDAYQLILDRSESCAGVLLHYDIARRIEPRVMAVQPQPRTGLCYCGFIGADPVRDVTLLSTAKRYGRLIGVIAADSLASRIVADRWGFEYAADEPGVLLADDRVDTLFLLGAPRHHARLVIAAIHKRKHVYVAPPLCPTPIELDEIRSARQHGQSQILVGFHRRFAPLVGKLRRKMPRGLPMTMRYAIRGDLPDPAHSPAVDLSGCIDLIAYLAGSPIQAVNAFAMEDQLQLNNTLAVSLRLGDGSIATLSHVNGGSSTLPREEIEITASGHTARLHDFVRLEIHRQRVEQTKIRDPDWGQAELVTRFLDSVRSGRAAPIPFQEIDAVMQASFAVRESVLFSRPVFF